jgi:hypothetical protein
MHACIAPAASSPSAGLDGHASCPSTYVGALRHASSALHSSRDRTTINTLGSSPSPDASVFFAHTTAIPVQITREAHALCAYAYVTKKK